MQALNGPDVKTNEHGEAAMHGRTVFCWTSAIPTGPLKGEVEG